MGMGIWNGLSRAISTTYDKMVNTVNGVTKNVGDLYHSVRKTSSHVESSSIEVPGEMPLHVFEKQVSKTDGLFISNNPSSTEIVLTLKTNIQHLEAGPAWGMDIYSASVLYERFSQLKEEVIDQLSSLPVDIEAREALIRREDYDTRKVLNTLNARVDAMRDDANATVQDHIDFLGELSEIMINIKDNISERDNDFRFTRVENSLDKIGQLLKETELFLKQYEKKDK